MRAFASPRNILITGASSGIGAALALAYAQPGHSLFLSGRNQERLEAVARQASGAGATCRTRVLDVTDRSAMADWLTESDTTAPLDLVVANAGISAGARKRSDAVRYSDTEIFATNVDGVVTTVTPLISAMQARRHGQIAVMSSLASFYAFRDAPAYCASKAAVRYYGAGLRRKLAPDGIGVSVICPGFVRSRMTDTNDFRMPLLWESDRAARFIRNKLARNRGTIAFPLPLYLGVRMLALI